MDGTAAVIDAQPSPHDVDAEKSVLGSVMIRPDAFVDLAFTLAPDDFFMPANRAIWAAMQEVQHRGLVIEPHVVGEELRARGELLRLEGGARYLTDLASFVPTSELASQYASIVCEKATSRRLIALCAETMSRSRGGVRSPELIEILTREAAKLVVQGPGDLTNAADLLPALITEFEARASSEGTISGIRTGIEQLDAITYGLDPGDLVVLAGDPGSGKTALAMQIAILLAIFDGGTALVCNMEMSKKALLERIIAYLGGVDSWNLRTGQISKAQWSAIYTAGSEIENGGALILEDRLFTMPQIVTRARAWRARNPKKRGVLLVDYLQRIRGGRGDNRAEQIGEWTSALKELATTLEVPVLLLSQLNRAPSKDKRPPTMRDLRESGDIEADADTVLLIHNVTKTEDGPTDLIIDKNRKGPCRVVSAHWTARHYRFSNVANETPRQQMLPLSA